MEDNLKRLWEIEDAFVEERGWSVSDQRAVDTWNSTPQVVNGHYTLSVPFKAQQPSLPDNKFLAKKRLLSSTKHLNKDNTLKKYKSAEKRMCRSSS